MKHGIEINMRRLASIDIAQDGKSAVMGGGVFVDEIIRTLDAKGKTTGKVPALVWETAVTLINSSNRLLRMCRSYGACLGWWIWPIYGLLRISY